MRIRGWMRRKKALVTERISPSAPLVQNRMISNRTSENIEEITNIFTQTPDLVIRSFTSNYMEGQVTLVYLDGLVDKNSINNNVLRPLMDPPEQGGTNIFGLLSISQISPVYDFQAVEDKILQGSSLLFIEGQREAYALDTNGWPQRAIEDPQLETSLKGAHQGFVETALQNIALIRRYIPNRELKIKEFWIGERGVCKVSVMFVEDIVDPDLLRILEDRITAITVDAVLNTGELEEMIEDNPYSPFPQFYTTERPDTAASHLLQGRIAIVVDRSPSVLIAPSTFVSFFQSVDDYSTRWLVSSFIRLLRFSAMVVATFLPALYIALISFNYELIPLDLILTVGESRERVPFPPLIEAVMMELTLEMLREAGVRLPSPIGQTVGIVGGIVIGQAVVQAGIVSNVMVIVVAFTAISSFIFPNYDMAAAIRLVRFAMMGLASMFGIIGIIIGFMILIGHLISLESLGAPYANPFAPVRFQDLKDTFLRLPLWLMKNRPTSVLSTQSRRQGKNWRKEDQQ